MSHTNTQNSNTPHYLYFLMIFLIAAMSQSLVVGVHETSHALSCMLVGNSVLEYSALHVDCQPSDEASTSTKFVAASGAIVNVIIGTIIYFVLGSGLNTSANWKWFLWLLMFSNWSYGFGYLIFSGISGAGDYATVIAGWEPATLWQIGMIVLGAGLWLGSIFLALRLLGRIFGKMDDLKISSLFHKLSIPSYLGAVSVIVCVASLNIHGIGGLPAIAGIMAAAGTLSPLFWMPFWFNSEQFPKQGIVLKLDFDYRWLSVAVLISLVYVVLFGVGFTFPSI